MEGGGEKNCTNSHKKLFLWLLVQFFFSPPPCCGAKEIVAWTVQKACSYLSLHDAREHAPTKVGPDRREEYLNLKYVVTVAKSHTQKDCQSCHETTVLSVGDILSSYGPPLFIRYQLVPPAAAPTVTVNAFDVQ